MQEKIEKLRQRIVNLSILKNQASALSEKLEIESQLTAAWDEIWEIELKARSKQKF